MRLGTTAQVALADTATPPGTAGVPVGTSLATAIEEGRNPSSMSGILVGTACRLLPA